MVKQAEKIDLFEVHRKEYIAPKKPALVEVGPATYLSVSGQGRPGGELFTTIVGALYSVAYTMKMSQKALGGDYTVGKLEAQWWTDDAGCGLATVPQDEWRWKLLIRTPDFIGDMELSLAVETLGKRGKSPNAKEIRLDTLREGLCVQMLHVGPYEREHETVRVMEEFARQKGLEAHGRHHEIYLSDPRRVPPQRLRTILRHPVKPRAACP